MTCLGIFARDLLWSRPCCLGRFCCRPSMTWFCAGFAPAGATRRLRLGPRGTGGAGALRSSGGPWRPGGSYSARRLYRVLTSARMRALQLGLSQTRVCLVSGGVGGARSFGTTRR